jgi:predicted Fe-Mo cluster-binding NifX family protein
MKICIPVAEERGMESPVFGHFGSAPFFAVHDTEKGTTVFLDNASAQHEHGACNPLLTLGNHMVDAILVGGIGARAITKLNEGGIRVYRAVPGSLAEALGAWTSGKLEEITPDEACSHHGGCSH